jgi:hypothetical protein
MQLRPIEKLAEKGENPICLIRRLAHLVVQLSNVRTLYLGCSAFSQ